MKRRLFFILCCLALSVPSNAQLIRSYGVKAAYTSANQDYNFKLIGKFDWDRRSGFNAAAFAEWFDVPFVSVVTQLEYAQRGYSYDAAYNSADSPYGYRVVKQNDRFDYLSVPILGKLRLPLGIFSPFIEAGPRVDFLLGYESGFGIRIPHYEEFKKTTLGASVGVGSEVHAPFMPVTLSLEARYNFDFAYVYSTEYLKVRNNSFDVWLGVGF